MRGSVRLLWTVALTLCLLTPGLARWDDDRRVREVEDHFHFGVSHDRLKTALLKSNHGGRFLDQGILLAHQMDQWEKYQQGIYYDWLPEFIKLVDEKLISGPLRELLFSILGVFLPDSYKSLVDYVEFADRFGGFDIIWQTVRFWDHMMMNAAAGFYIANVEDPEDDDEWWDMIRMQWPTSDPQLTHEFLRDTYYRFKRYQATLQAECDRFREDVEALLHGAVRISTVFDNVDLLYGACAPETVTFFGGESVGVNGADIVAWEWKLGSQVVSDQPSFSASFFTAGSVTATLTVRDANGQILSGSRTLYFGSPFIHVKDMNRGSMTATFRTRTSPLIANYTWSFGDGSQSVSGPNLSQVSHQFPALGRYTVRLTVRTVQGNDLTKTYDLSFDPIPTDVYGTIEHSQVWGPAGSPYRIRGIVTIPKGVRITLLPGTVVQGWTRSSDKGRLDVYGELVSQGKFAASKRVYFTSYRDESPPTLGGSDEGQTGDWQGLRIYAGSFATLSGSTVRYASTGVGGSPAAVAGVRFEKNVTGVSISNRQSPVLAECQFFGSTSKAAYLSSCSGRLNFRGLSGNGTNGVYLWGCTVSEDSVWEGHGGFAYVLGGCSVASGATLTLLPGTVVKVERGSMLSVYGSLVASGTEQSPITFTSLKDDTAGGDTNGDGGATVPSPGDWRGILVSGSGASALMERCVVRYGGYVYEVRPSVEAVSGGSLTLRGCVVERSYHHGVGVTSSSLELSGCVVQGNGSDGVYIYQPSQMPVVRDTSFVGNGGRAVRLASYSGRLSFLGSGCTFSGNGTNGVYLWGCTVSEDSVWEGHGGFAYVLGGCSVASGATLTLLPGTVVKVERGSMLSVYGSLVASGTEQSPITFTSLKDDTAGGDTNGDGGATVPSPGDWRGILVSGSGASALMERCVVRYGGYVYNYVYPSVEAVSGGSLTLRGCVVERSYHHGVGVTSSSLELSGCVVQGNGSDGVYIYQPSQMPVVRDTSFVGNGGRAVRLASYSGRLSFLGSGCTFSGNGTNGVYLWGCTVSEDSVWEGHGGFAYVLGGCSVASGATLTLLPGTVVKGERGSMLSVYGSLVASGTEQSPITFTSLKDDTAGGDTNGDGGATVPSPGDWRGILVSGSGASALMERCVVRYGGYVYNYVYPSVEAVSGGSLTLRGCVVERSYHHGVGVTSSSLELSGCVVQGNGSDGVYIYQPSSLELSGCVVQGNGSDGVYIYQPSQMPVVRDTSFVGNGGRAVRLASYSGRLSFLGSGCTFSGNGTNGVYLWGCTVSEDSVWEGHGGFAYVLGGCSVASGATLTLLPGTVVKGERGSMLSVYGSLVASGTEQSPITFTSLKDDTAGGDTNGDGGATVPSPGDWPGILVSGSGASALMERCVVRYGGYVYEVRPSVEAVSGGSLTLRGCVVERSYHHGVGVTSSSLELSGCVVQGNGSDGVYIYRPSSLELSGCVVQGNGSSGVSVSEGSTPTVTDSLFWNNKGTAILLSSCSGALIANVSVAKNSGSISCYSSTVNLANSIVAFNASGIYRSRGTLTLVNNCVYGNTNYNYSGVSPGPTDISVDPSFWNLALGDLHLLPGSPCIDAGDDTGVQPGQTDIDGQPRILGAHVDIGADEWTPGYIGPAGPPVQADKNVKVRIRGRVVFRDYVGPMPESVLLELRNPGSTDPFATETVTLSPSGSFTLSAPSRPFDLSLKHSHWLRRTLPIIPGGDPNFEMVFDLLNGDVNGDNRVALEDLSRVLVAFTQMGPRDEDLDGDGLVGLSDLSIVLLQFTRVGDP